MNYVNIGKIITTHGLNGEIKITSDFKFKKQVFVKGFILYIGENYEKHEILNYRIHKGYDMVILDKIDDIEKAIKYKKKCVYVDASKLNLNNEHLDSDFIGLSVYYNNEKIGLIDKIVDAGCNNLLIMLDNGKYIPKNDYFIDSIDFESKKIILKNVEGLL